MTVGRSRNTRPLISVGGQIAELENRIRVADISPQVVYTWTWRSSSSGIGGTRHGHFVCSRSTPRVVVRAFGRVHRGRLTLVVSAGRAWQVQVAGPPPAKPGRTERRLSTWSGETPWPPQRTHFHLRVLGARGGRLTHRLRPTHGPRLTHRLRPTRVPEGAHQLRLACDLRSRTEPWFGPSSRPRSRPLHRK